MTHERFKTLGPSFAQIYGKATAALASSPPEQIQSEIRALTEREPQRQNSSCLSCLRIVHADESAVSQQVMFRWKEWSRFGIHPIYN